MVAIVRSPHSLRRRIARLVTTGIALPVVLWACTAHDLEAPNPLPEQQTPDLFEANPIRDIDLLFLIDDSGSTQNKQDNFVGNFPVFINALEQIPGGLPNVHIGVVTSDLGAAGAVTMNGCMGSGDAARFQVNALGGGANCGIATGEQFIIASESGTVTNLMPGLALANVFACMANRGARGCGYEHQLAAVNAALHPRPDWNPMNEGFLRPDAYLAIIMLTDEDDCSAPDDATDFYMSMAPAGWSDNARCAAAGHMCNDMPVPTPDLGASFSVPLGQCRPNPGGTLIPVEKIVADIKALKPGHEERIIAAAIAGWPAPGQEGNARYTLRRGGMNGATELVQVCTNAGGGAPALRVKAFVDSFIHGTIQTVCQANFAGALQAIGDLVKGVVGDPCLSRPLMDVDGKTPGVQAECVVADRVPGPRPKDTALPQCAPGAPKPCWSLIADANACRTSGFKIQIDRDGKMAPPGIEESIKCRTCAKPGDPRCQR
jgi:hypothetical protein